MSDDQSLLREFATRRSEAAFATLVERYLGLVHSAAVRQVHDPHVAQEITQAVFILLARKARTLGPDTILPAWLYRAARYAAADTLKAQRRRQRREQEAYMQSTLNEPDAWAQVAPLLDEAMAELSDRDRTALVLRFFENKPVPEIAGALKLTEDAAQKRVARALEKLRAIFTKRGVTLTGAAIAGAVSANAIQAVPLGLAAKIAAAAVLAGTTLATTSAIVMTTLQKTIIGATLAVAVGTGIYEARQASTARAEVQTLKQKQTTMAAQVQQLTHERDEAKNRLATLGETMTAMERNSAELLRLRGEVTRLRNEAGQANDPFVQTALAWKAKKEKLQKLFDERQGQRIPEMQFLTDQQWLDIGRDSDLDSEDGILSAFSAVRNAAKRAFVPMMQKAVIKYMAGNNSSLPQSISLLRPYFEPPVDDALLQRYELLDKKAQEWLSGAVVREKDVVDPMREGRAAIGAHFSSTGSPPAQSKPYNFPPELSPALRSYQGANKNQFPKDFSELEPYLTTPEQKAALEKLIYLLKH